MKKVIYAISLILIGVAIGLGSMLYIEKEKTNHTKTEDNIQIQEENTNDTFATDIYKKYANSVVSVVNLQKVSIHDFFGREYSTNQEMQQGVGSGFVYKKSDGYYYALTNNHVVEGSDSLNIVLNNESNKQEDAEVINADLVGVDEDNDLAVIKFKTNKQILPVEIGTSSNLLPGQDVLAIGSPYGVDFEGTITSGIVSAPVRTVEQEDGTSLTYIQTDAAINPGNSGGPLFDATGKVIGINTMKISDSESDNMGFAIPIDRAMKIAKQIEAK